MDTDIALITAVVLDENWVDSGVVDCLTIDEWSVLARTFYESDLLSSTMSTRLVSRIQVLVEASGVDNQVFWWMLNEEAS
jgi:hypothetical protein